ncbi:MAG TPA: CpXC domain-containing protein [Jatrophihabitantaceae bacterium]|jgi:hypothetical protein
MPSFASETVNALCQSCGAALRIRPWLVVDIHERPDLTDQINDGSIREFTCGSCGHRTQFADALLFYRPNKLGTVVGYLVTSEADEAAVQEEGAPLVTWLAWAEGTTVGDVHVIVIPWSHAALVTSRDLQVDLETPDANLALPSEFGDFAASYRQLLHSIRDEVGLA